VRTKSAALTNVTAASDCYR